MIKFRQKLYVLSALVTEMGKDLAVQGAIGVGTTAMSNNAQEKQNQEQIDAQEKQNQEQIKAQEKQNKRLVGALNNLSSVNPGASQIAGQVVGQAQMSDTRLNFFNQREFAFIPKSVRNLKKSDFTGFGKDLWSFAKTDGVKKYVKNGLAFGGLMAGGSYLADKAIQKDQQNLSNDQQNPEKKSTPFYKNPALLAGGAAVGAALLHPKVRGLVSKPAKLMVQKTGMGKGEAAMALGMGALMPAAGYMMTRGKQQQAENGMAENTQKQYSEYDQQQNQNQGMSTGKKVLLGAGALAGTVGTGLLARKSPTLRKWGNSALNKFGWNDWKKTGNTGGVNQGWKNTNEGMFGTLKGIFSTKRGKSARSIAKTINNFNMAGGETGLQTFHNHMANTNSGSKITKGLTDFIDHHKTTALLAAAPVGMAGMAATFDLGEKAVNKGLRLADKNAYKYQDSQEEQMQ